MKTTKKPVKRAPAEQVEVNKLAKHTVAQPMLDEIEVPIKGTALDIEFDKIIKTLPDLKVKLAGNISIPASGGDSGAEVPGAPTEPVYDAKKRAAIQGNIIPGFNKDHQHFLFFCISDIKHTKKWLKWISPLISSLEDVLTWVRAYRSMKARLGEEPPMCATWVNMAFSDRAIATLTSKVDAAAFGDQSFRQGLAARSTYLGDPTKSTHPGHRKHWVVGGPKNEADIIVIVAADDSHDLVSMTNAIKNKARAATMHGSYLPNQSFHGTIVYVNGETERVTSTYDGHAESPPNLNLVAGTYAGLRADNHTVTVTVESAGTLSGHASDACTFAGTLSPRAKGNVFHTSVTFGGGACRQGTETVTGVALYDAATHRLYSAALNHARTTSFLFLGTKR